MKMGMRINVVSGDQTAGFVLPDPPFPEVGDTCQFMNREWTVTTIEPAEILLNIPRIQISACTCERLNEDGICRRCGTDRRRG